MKLFPRLSRFLRSLDDSLRMTRHGEPITVSQIRPVDVVRFSCNAVRAARGHPKCICGWYIRPKDFIEGRCGHQSIVEAKAARRVAREIRESPPSLSRVLFEEIRRFGPIEEAPPPSRKRFRPPPLD